MQALNDTIAALATAPQTAGLSVIRISGPEAHKIGLKLFRPRDPNCTFPPNKLCYGHLYDLDGGLLDEVLYARFAAGKSYTREETAEIQFHGGTKLAAAVLAQVHAAGARPARPGEFTLRAFLNGRIDLTQAEAVAEVIAARSEAGLRAAARQLTGDLYRRLEAVRQELLEARTLIEAYLDFPDEEATLDRPALTATLNGARTFLAQARDSYRTGRLLRDGAEVVIAGRPNVGKSSLLNRLVGRERAIVTPVPGTTRDMIEETVEIGGVPVRFVDTAGLRGTVDPVERIGVERATARTRTADLTLGLLDGSEPPTTEDAALVKTLSPDRTLWVFNKADLPQRFSPEELTGLGAAGPMLRVSAATGSGLEELERRIRELLLVGEASAGEVVLLSARHAAACAAAAEALTRAALALDSGGGLELVAADIGQAMSELEDLIGVSPADEVLERIFSRFCIGK